MDKLYRDAAYVPVEHPSLQQSLGFSRDYFTTAINNSEDLEQKERYRLYLEATDAVLELVNENLGEKELVYELEPAGREYITKLLVTVTEKNKDQVVEEVYLYIVASIESRMSP